MIDLFLTGYVAALADFVEVGAAELALKVAGKVGLDLDELTENGVVAAVAKRLEIIGAR